jgi:four helix bundle protein
LLLIIGQRAEPGAMQTSKITIVEEECDETLFWLELISEANLIEKEKLLYLLKEADELTAIFTA